MRSVCRTITDVSALLVRKSAHLDIELGGGEGIGVATAVLRPIS